MLLHNESVNNKIKQEMKRYLEDNENTMTPNLGETAKAVLREKFIGIQAYKKKQEKSQKQSKYIPKGTRKTTTKSKVGRRKEIIKTRSEINEIGSKKTTEKNQWNQLINL